MRIQKGIAFDFDGVLVDSLGRFLEHAAVVAASLGHPRSPSLRDLDALDQMKVIDFARQIDLPEAVVEQFRDEVYDRIQAEQANLRFFTDMKDVLAQALDQFHVAIVTANRERVVQDFLERQGLAQRVHAIYGEEGGYKAKKLAAFAQSAAVSIKQVFMIGDAVSDVRAAQQAGAKSIAVTWGGQSFGKLATALPDYILESPQALSVLLTRLAT